MTSLTVYPPGAGVLRTAVERLRRGQCFACAVMMARTGPPRTLSILPVLQYCQGVGIVADTGDGRDHRPPVEIDQPHRPARRSAGIKARPPLHLSPAGRGRNVRAPRVHIPGEWALEPIATPFPPHPDRASAIRPLPCGER